MMDEQKPQSEPLRRFITPEQLGLGAFVILFWAIAIHYTVAQFWQGQKDCPVIVEQSRAAALNIERCVEE